MFCTKCGAQMDEGVKFCPRCGAPTGIASQTLGGTPGQAFTGPGGKTPVRPVQPVAGGNSAMMLVGMVGALIMLIAIFLPVMKASVFGLSESANAFKLMNEEDLGILNVLAIGGSLIVILMQLTKHPKLSLIGVIMQVFYLIAVIVYYADNRDLGYGVKFTLEIGFWLMLLSVIACIAAAFVGKRK